MCCHFFFYSDATEEGLASEFFICLLLFLSTLLHEDLVIKTFDLQLQLGCGNIEGVSYVTLVLLLLTLLGPGVPGVIGYLVLSVLPDLYQFRKGNPLGLIPGQNGVAP